MDNKDILRIAKMQSAIDLNCIAEDFDRPHNVIVTSASNQSARKYLKLPFQCALVSYGTNIVASIQNEFYDIVYGYINKHDAAHCFETPNIYMLNDAFEPFGLRVCIMAEYFLPDVTALKEKPCAYDIAILKHNDFIGLYTEEWSNALCRERSELDVLGVAAYDQGKLVGLAACSADCDSMWQIGIDVLPAYRRKGIASALTSRLAIEILKLDKVPFYCSSWCNLRSVKNAINSGFKPSWAEILLKPKESAVN
ncbi:MAG: GNAT family N-acetyltransferase [Oscillospiraceae bacterium]